MRKIYLATDSRARKKLFGVFGLKFKVLSSGVKEMTNRGSLSYPQLVKRNALKKAREVAGKVKGGIIIGADTITVQDGKIFGKPRDLRDARLMLKRLSKKPQWLYTGIAVIDKDKGKTLLDYEKTKVHMDRLTDKEIRNYFRRVCPLDKAGSFDIQGKGAFFISRIEGCFYNVVGLPLRKLYQMFKKMKILKFCYLLLIAYSLQLTAGCSPEYNIVTGQEELIHYSTDREVRIGVSISRQIEEKYELVDDPLVQKRVADIGKRLVSVCDRQDIDYIFKALEDDDANAVSLPGGFIYVNHGLIDKVDSDDELACVLAHEVGHIVARHSIKKLQALQGYSFLRILMVAVPKSGAVGNAADIAFSQLLMGYSREDELLADRLGVRYAKAAGYDPHAMIRFLEKLQEINRRKPLRPRSYFKTHPYIPDRIRVVKQELGEGIDFKDYINIEESPYK